MVYKYQCRFCGKKRSSHFLFCEFCGFDSPFGSERFWKFFKGKSLLELGTGFGDSAIYAAKNGFEVVTIDNNSEQLQPPVHSHITNIEFDIYNFHFWEPEKKFDTILIDLNTDILPTFNFYSKFLNENGVIIVDGFF